MLAAPAFSAIPLSPSAIARRALMNADDHRHMARALTLAARGLYYTDPNPRVGCVLVRDGEVVGEGWHGRDGEPHAEVFALRAAGARARGATVYVTLEPCCHHGRTPPCSDALIAAGVARVVCAMTDPNPRVAGQGLAQLAAAGSAGETDVLAPYMAPKLLGDGARGLFRLPEWRALAECIDVRITDMRAVGADWRIMARIDNNSR